MKIAFGHLRYDPDVFWEFSLREWQACYKGYVEKEYGVKQKPMNQDRLKEMMERYPDK
jgi:uncharacterized phage protein (TIGR02216 family)